MISKVVSTVRTVYDSPGFIHQSLSDTLSILQHCLDVKCQELYYPFTKKNKNKSNNRGKTLKIYQHCIKSVYINTLNLNYLTCLGFRENPKIFTRNKFNIITARICRFLPTISLKNIDIKTQQPTIQWYCIITKWRLFTKQLIIIT